MTGGRGNLLAIAASRAVTVVSGLVVSLALVRALPREAFADYRWIWACVSVAAFGIDLGLWQLVTRRVARDASLAPRLVAVALQSTAVLSVATTALVCAYVAFRDPRPELVVAAALAAGTVAFTSAAHHVQAAFYGLRRMILEVPSLLASRVVFVAGNLGLLAVGAGIVPLYAARLISTVVLFVGALVTFRRAVGPLDARLVVEDVRNWTIEGRHFGSAVFFGALVAQADVLLLEALSTPEEVARYAGPASVLLQLAILPNILTSGLFPRLSGLDRGDPEAADELGFQVRVMLLLSLPIAFGGTALAEPFVVWVFGEPYRDSVVPFVWILATVPVRFLHNAYGVALTAFDGQPLRARIVAASAVLNVVGNLVAIPAYGADGAAVVTFVTDLLLLVLLRVALARDVSGAREVEALVRAGAPAVAMAFVVLVLPGHVGLRVVAGAVLYAGLSWLAGAWRRRDLGRLARL